MLFCGVGVILDKRESERNRNLEMNGKKIWKEIVCYGKIILFSLLAAFFISRTLIANAQVPTGSMESTIMTGSRIIINRLAYLAAKPERGDIIAFQCPDETDPKAVPYLKRIIALSGETIEGKDGKVYIDGCPLEEPYLTGQTVQDFGPYTVPGDSCFVMGDNRNNSWDSRFWVNKFVNYDVIAGRAEFEYYPEPKLLH